MSLQKVYCDCLFSCFIFDKPNLTKIDIILDWIYRIFFSSVRTLPPNWRRIARFCSRDPVLRPYFDRGFLLVTHIFFADVCVRLHLKLKTLPKFCTILNCRILLCTTEVREERCYVRAFVFATICIRVGVKCSRRVEALRNWQCVRQCTALLYYGSMDAIIFSVFVWF